MPAPQRTSLDEIVGAGRSLLESGGLAGLTMQAVAAQVGVRAPSLYKWVNGREALVGLVATAVNEELADRLERAPLTIAGQAAAYRAFANEYPEGYRLIGSAVLPPESVARSSAPIVRVARNLVGEDHALEAARFVTAWATGFIGMELAGAFRLDGDLDAAFNFGVARIEDSLRSRD